MHLSRARAGKWHLTDTLLCAQSQNMRAKIVLRLQRVSQGRFSCTGSAKRETDTKLLKICEIQTLSEVSVSFSMCLCRKKDPNRFLRWREKTISTKADVGFDSQISRACAGKWTLTDTFRQAQRGLVEGVCSILAEPVQENGL